MVTINCNLTGLSSLINLAMFIFGVCALAIEKYPSESSELTYLGPIAIVDVICYLINIGYNNCKHKHDQMEPAEKAKYNTFINLWTYFTIIVNFIIWCLIIRYYFHGSNEFYYSDNLIGMFLYVSFIIHSISLSIFAIAILVLICYIAAQFMSCCCQLCCQLSCCNRNIPPSNTNIENQMMHRPHASMHMDIIKNIIGINSGNTECCICLTEFSVNDTDLAKLHCNHYFHKECITKWISEHNTCPYCRQTIENSTPKYSNPTHATRVSVS
jgi:hypothetical protein